MVHRAVLVTPILTHHSILLMVLLIITSTLKDQFGHDVLNTEMKSAGKHSLKYQSFRPYQLFFFFKISSPFWIKIIVYKIDILHTYPLHMMFYMFIGFYNSVLLFFFLPVI